MALINRAGQEVSAKIVYYGPGLSGKTTNLEILFKQVPEDSRGKMISMKTRTDRTLFFDLLPVNAEPIRDFHVRILLYTVPGQVYYNATRRLVLKGVDALVFVADSQRGKMEENLESLENLRSNLADMSMKLGDVPWVIQYNKRDMPDVMSVSELEEALNPGGVPSFEAVATTGDGIHRTLQGVVGLLRPGIEARLEEELGSELKNQGEPSEATIESKQMTPEQPVADSETETMSPDQPTAAIEPDVKAPQQPAAAIKPEPVPPESQGRDSEPERLTPQISQPVQVTPPAMATFMDQGKQPIMAEDRLGVSSGLDTNIPSANMSQEKSVSGGKPQPFSGEGVLDGAESRVESSGISLEGTVEAAEPLVVEISLSDEQINSRSMHSFLIPDIINTPGNGPVADIPGSQPVSVDEGERGGTSGRYQIEEIPPRPTAVTSPSSTGCDVGEAPRFTVKIPWKSLESGELNLRIVLTGSNSRDDVNKVETELIP